MPSLNKHMIPNKINYIWQGPSAIDRKYLDNVNECSRLNPSYQIHIWKESDCDRLIDKYTQRETYETLSGIKRYNFIKYLIMHDQGGIYTDFDIKWKTSFDFLMNLPHRYSGSKWPQNVDYNSDANLYFPCYIKQDVILADDPFFICAPGIMLECLEFCHTRNDYKIDIELFYKTGVKRIHESEPYGPYGLTDWLQQNNIQFNLFFSEEVIERKSLYAEHENEQRWR